MAENRLELSFRVIPQSPSTTLIFQTFSLVTRGYRS